MEMEMDAIGVRREGDRILALDAGPLSEAVQRMLAEVASGMSVDVRHRESMFSDGGVAEFHSFGTLSGSEMVLWEFLESLAHTGGTGSSIRDAANYWRGTPMASLMVEAVSIALGVSDGR